MKFLPSDEQFDYYIKQSKKFKENWFQRRSSVYNTYERNMNTNIDKNLIKIEYLTESECPIPKLVNLLKINSNLQQTYKQYGKKIHDEFFDKLTFDENLFKYEFYKIYIPSLRGLIPVNFDENIDYFAERTKIDCFDEKSAINTDISNLINNNEQTKNAIITGQKFYEYVRNYLLGDLNQRDTIKQYEEYLSETFFNGEKIVLIPKINDDVLTVKIGKEMERPIFSLGEGIQSIIILTLPLFLYLEKTKETNTNILVFIEEP